jgi:DNA modification methylase
MRLHFPAFTAWKLHGCQVTFRHGEASSVLGSNKLNIRGLKGFASLFGETSGLRHPTQKPVALFSRALRNSTIRGERVCDVFVGSGTTLIACEQLGRICYAMEIEPKYCDVVVTRWEQYTGKKAQRIPAAAAPVAQEVVSPVAG